MSHLETLVTMAPEYLLIAYALHFLKILEGLEFDVVLRRALAEHLPAMQDYLSWSGPR